MTLDHYAYTVAIIGVFLLFFHGVYLKRRDVGKGMDTPEKRIMVYGAIGIAAVFIAPAIILLIYT